MKKIAIILLIALILGGCESDPPPSKDVEYDLQVMFVGNSFTSLNDLPEMFVKLAESGGKVVYQASSTQDSTTLLDHGNLDEQIGEKTIHKMGDPIYDWDYVVLQEQSVLPVVYSTYFSDGVDKMVSAINSATEHAAPALYMTWGKRDGFEGQAYAQMNEQLVDAYRSEAEIHDILLLPAGDLWGKMYEENEEFWQKLWYNDGSHPSYMGSYLNACVFYASFFKESPVGLWHDSRQIDAEDAKLIQTFVADYFEL